jgi:hypothetical protein
VTSTSTSLPAPLQWAVRLLAVEALAAGFAAALLVYQGIAGDAGSPGDALAVAGFVGVTAAAIAGLAAALARRKPRARAPAIVLQLMAVMFGVVLLTGGVFWLGVPVGLLGVAVATLLLTPSTHTALS